VKVWLAKRDFHEKAGRVKRNVERTSTQASPLLPPVRSVQRNATGFRLSTSVKNSAVEPSADEREAHQASRRFSEAAFLSYQLNCGTARSGQGRAGFARRSGPLTARTVLQDVG
jgi:hypothetical protein